MERGTVAVLYCDATPIIHRNHVFCSGKGQRPASAIVLHATILISTASVC